MTTMADLGPKYEHDLRGNCTSDQAYTEHEDACPDHDEPRGQCSGCGDCQACFEEITRTHDEEEED